MSGPSGVAGHAHRTGPGVCRCKLFSSGTQRWFLLCALQDGRAPNPEERGLGSFSWGTGLRCAGCSECNIGRRVGLSRGPVRYGMKMRPRTLWVAR